MERSRGVVCWWRCSCSAEVGRRRRHISMHAIREVRPQEQELPWQMQRIRKRGDLADSNAMGVKTLEAVLRPLRWCQGPLTPGIL